MSVRLDIRHLIMIDAIAVTESLSAAARAMHITQSALSHRIREAERRVGAELVGKRNGRAFLTPAGRLLLPVAQNALLELERAERTIDAFSHRPGATVRLYASTLIGYQWLPDFVAAMEADGVEAVVQVTPDLALDPLAALKAKLVDLVVVPATASAGYFAFTPLFDDELIAILPGDHPKAGRAFLAAQDFKDETYFSNYPKRDAGHEYERFFEPAGVVPDRIFHVGAAENCVAFVRAGKGVTILTGYAAAHYARTHGLARVRLAAEGVPIQWSAAVRHDEAGEGSVSHVAQALARFAPWGLRAETI